MDWIQFLIFIFAFIGTFSWLKHDISLNRTEATADRRDMLTLLRKMEADTTEFRKLWVEESKEFHGKLCALDERSKKQ